MFKFLKNEYIFSILTKFVTVAIGLVRSVVVARFLGAALQGEMASISSIVSVGSIVVTFGMHQAYPYFRQKYGKENIYDDFLNITVYIYLLYAAIASAATLLVHSHVAVAVALLLIPLYGYNNVVTYVYLIEEPNARNRLWTVISFLDVCFVTALAMLTERSFFSVIIILTFEELCKCVAYTRSLHIRLRLQKRLIPLAGSIMKIGFFPMLALLMTMLNYKVDILMLGLYKFITQEQIGVYSIGIVFADKIALIPDTLKGVMASKLAKGADESHVAKVCRLCFWTNIASCTALWLLGRYLISWLYGAEYTGAYEVMLTCAAGAVFVGYFKLIAQHNIIHRKQIRNVLILSVSVVLNVLLNLLLIPRYQLLGAAFASGVGYFASGVIFIVWFSQEHYIPMRDMFFIRKSDLDFIKRYIC